MNNGIGCVSGGHGFVGPLRSLGFAYLPLPTIKLPRPISGLPLGDQQAIVHTK
jgi:hypothetical protein